VTYLTVRRGADGVSAPDPYVTAKPAYLFVTGTSIGAQFCRPCSAQSWAFCMAAMVSAIHTPAVMSTDTITTAMTFISMRCR